MAEQEDDPEADRNRAELIRDLNEAYGLTTAAHLSAGDLENLLSERLNILIRDDFSGLVRLLYRIDINEERLKRLLQSQTGSVTDAGRIIARLIIDRQLQKIESRRAYGKSNSPIKDLDKIRDGNGENDPKDEDGADLKTDDGDNDDGEERW